MRSRSGRDPQSPVPPEVRRPQRCSSRDLAPDLTDMLPRPAFGSRALCHELTAQLPVLGELARAPQLEPLTDPPGLLPGASGAAAFHLLDMVREGGQDRKSTRLNSSHVAISYAVFCLKKKKYTGLLNPTYPIKPNKPWAHAIAG